LPQRLNNNRGSEEPPLLHHHLGSQTEKEKEANLENNDLNLAKESHRTVTVEAAARGLRKFLSLAVLHHQQV
jgi:hypothetical protein